MKRHIPLAAAAVLVFCSTSARAADWTITDLGPHTGYSEPVSYTHLTLPTSDLV